ncbi:unnamed protein product, partial [Ectocarpus fasciculatus]
MDTIKVAGQKADEFGLEGRSKEDFILNETLGKKLVPEEHLSEATQIILGPRHSTEMSNLLKVNFTERVDALRSSVEGVLESKTKERISLLDRLSSNNATEATVIDELKRFEAEYNVKQRNIEESVVNRLEGPHTQQQIALRQRQLEDIAETMNMYSDSESLARIRDLAGKSQEEMLAEYRSKLSAEETSRRERLEKEREEAEIQLRREHEDQLRRVQETLKEEEAKAEAELEAKREALVKRNEEFQRKQEEVTGEHDNAEKERIRAAFEKEHEVALNALQHEKKTQKDKLKDRLTARRKSSIMDGSEDKMGMMSSASAPVLPPARKTIAKPMDRADSNLQNTGVMKSIHLIENKLERIDRVIGQLESGGIGGAGVATKALEARFERVLEMLEKNDAQKIPGAPLTSAAQPVYQDSSEPHSGDELVVVPDDSLPLQDQARLDFGRNLAGMVGLHHIDLKAVSALPPSTVQNNSFKNSYFYDHSSKTLYVHSSRLSSSGDFGLVVIHALSHIKINPTDMSNDTDPAFMAEFYTNIKILNQDLYKKTTVAGPNLGATRPTTRNMLSRGDSHRNLSQTRGQSSTHLLNQEARPTPGEYFTAQHMQDRVRQYAEEAGIPAEYIERYSQEAK